jgi:hypothetical protein
MARALGVSRGIIQVVTVIFDCACTTPYVTSSNPTKSMTFPHNTSKDTFQLCISATRFAIVIFSFDIHCARIRRFFLYDIFYLIALNKYYHVKMLS